MNQEIRQALDAYTRQGTDIISKLAAGQPVTKEDCDKLAQLQTDLSKLLNWPAT